MMMAAKEVQFVTVSAMNFGQRKAIGKTQIAATLQKNIMVKS